MPNSSIPLTILFILVACAMLGSALALFADLVWQNQALKLSGVALALAAALVYLAFRLRDRAEQRRQAAQENRAEDEERG